MKRIFLLFICGLLGMQLIQAQSTRKIRELEKQRNELSRQINESETLLRSTKKDVSSQLNDLALLSGQIDERRKYVETIERDVNAIQTEIDRLGLELHQLQLQLADKRNKYERAVKYMYRNKSIQEKLMFIFSADNLMQMYRRLRYVRQYADYQRIQGEQVKRKQQQVEDKKTALLGARQAKEVLLRQGADEKLKLEAQEKERKALLESLQTKQRGIQQELAAKRRSANQLNAQIDRLIEIEIEKARKRAEEERRRKAEEERRKQEAEEARRRAETGRQTAEAGKKKEEKKEVAPGQAVAEAVKPKTREEVVASKKTTEKMEAYRTDSEDRRLSGTFERNKGILPVPITGAYVVVGHYGQYQVGGLRNVRLDNKGVDIKGKPGAYARAVFDGEVSAIFQYNGLTNVLVRHGSYISVYCNLSSVRVKKGSHIRTRDVIGQVHTDNENNTVLHFQLRRETTKLNPEAWIHF